MDLAFSIESLSTFKKKEAINEQSGTRQAIAFLPCHNLATKLPTTRLNCQQFGHRTGFVLLVAANVASSC